MPPPSIPLAAIRQPAFLYDAGGRVSEANDRAESLAGRPLAGCSAADVAALVRVRRPDGSPVAPADLPASRAARGEEAVDVPLAITAADGSTLDVLASASPIRDGDAVAGALVVWQDVTGLVAANEALSETEARFRSLLSSTLDGLYRRDLLSDRFEYCSPSMAELVDLPLATVLEMPASSVLDRVHPDDLPRVLAGKLDASGTTDGAIDYRLRRGDGTWVWLSDRFSYIRDADGRPVAREGSVRDITGRKRAEEALRKNEARLVEAQRLAKVGDWEWDLATDGVVWSRETSAIFGRDPDLPAPGFRDEQSRYYTPESWARLSEAVRSAIEAGEPYDLEVEVVREDGDHRWLAARGEAVRDASGAVTTLRGTVQDFTGRKRAETALRESERQYRELVDSANSAIIRWRADGTLIFANRYAGALFGYGPGELIGKSASLLVPEQDSTGADLTELMREILAQPDRRATNVNENVCRDGSRLWMLWTNRAILDEHGEVTEVLAIGTDITGQRRAAEQLEQHEALLARVLGLSMDGIYRRDLSTGRYEYANPALAAITGYSLDELLRMDLDAIRACVHPDDREFVREVRESPGSWSGTAEYRFRHRDGAYRWISEHYTVEAGEDGRPRFVTGVVRDVTERRESEEALLEYAENLRRSNEDLERFAYVSSHDLQEPLRSIVSFSQLLERRYKGQLGQDADEYIAFIVEGDTRMQALILDLLAYSRVNSKAQELRPTDAEAVMAAVERQVDPQLRESGATLSYDPLPTVMADPLQLEQVLTNLVGNAIKFRRADEPLRIRVGARRTDDMWEFSVADNGIGIEPEYFEKIFVIFQRLHTKDAYPGTGIGLAIVKRIIDRHGGRVRVESAPSEGSTFFFTLPAA